MRFPLLVALGLAGALCPAPAPAQFIDLSTGRVPAADVSGLGALATQSAGAVAITGGTVAGANLATSDASATVATPTGATAGRTLAAHLADVFNVQDFSGCTWDGVADVSACVQAAVNAAAAKGGGRVVIPAAPAGVYVGGVGKFGWPVASTIIIGNGTTTALSTQNGVVLKGIPGGGEFARLGLYGSLGMSGAVLRWTGSAGGTMVQINGPANGNAVANLGLDAAGSAATCLRILSDRMAEFPNITCANNTGIGLDINTQPVTTIAPVIRND